MAVKHVIRALLPDEFPEFVTLLEMAAGRRPTEDAHLHAAGAYPLARALGIFESGHLVGGTSSTALELTVPGGATRPVVRPTLAAVAPSARGRGLASALLSHQLKDYAQRGEELAVAFTSVPGLIAPVGYAPASVACEIEVDLAYVKADPRLRSDLVVRLIDPAEARRVLPGLFERHRLRQLGQVSRSSDFWERWWQDVELYRIGRGERFFAVAEDAGGDPQGYLTYRLTPGDLRDQPVSSLVVEDLVASSQSAHRALWQFCLSFRQARTVHAWNAAADDPLRWLLGDPRGLARRRTRDFLWLRLVDLQAALSSRTYGDSSRLVFEVRDDALPRNSGTYTLETGDGGVDCHRSSETPQLSLDVADLAAAYLGGTSFSTLARAGRVRQHTSGAVDQADRLFSTRQAPWTVTDW